jgi:hypothetical protein
LNRFNFRLDISVTNRKQWIEPIQLQRGDVMEAMVFAGSLIKETYAPSGRDAVRPETLYSGPGQGWKDVARVAAMLGGIVLYAGLVAMGGG